MHIQHEEFKKQITEISDRHSQRIAKRFNINPLLVAPLVLDVMQEMLQYTSKSLLNVWESNPQQKGGE